MAKFKPSTSIAPGLFSTPGPVQIQYRHAERLARICGFGESETLHSSMQLWADSYHAQNDTHRIRPIEDKRREAAKVIGSIRKTIAYLNSDQGYPASHIRKKFNEALLLQMIERQPQTLGDVAFPVVEIDDIIDLLERATNDFEERLSREEESRKQARKDHPYLRKLPDNPGLILTLKNMKRFWTTYATDQSAFSPYFNIRTGTPNRATCFAVLTCRLIDPSVPRSSIISQMKKLG